MTQPVFQLSQKQGPVTALIILVLLLFYSSLCASPLQTNQTAPPPNRLLDVRYHFEGESFILTLEADCSVADYRFFTLDNPSRLVIDIFNVTALQTLSGILINHTAVRQIRFGVSPKKVRIVLDSPLTTLPPFSIENKNHTLLIALGPSSQKTAGAEKKPSPLSMLSTPVSSEPITAHPPAVDSPVTTPPVTAPLIRKQPAPKKIPAEPPQAQPDSNLTGTEIARRAYDRDDGNDSYAVSSMVLIDSKGNERKREFTVQRKDFGALTKTLVRFTAPADIANTGFLSWERENDDDEQFLYLPELRRVRRIVSGNKNRRFVNTDFTFEDLERRKVENDDHRLVRRGSFNEMDCYVIESIPKKGTRSQYTKLVSWITGDGFVPVMIEYYTKKNKPTKLFSVRTLQKIDNIWTVMVSEMADLEKGTRTITVIEQIIYNRGIPDEVFTKRYLEKK